jgi:hypothetical protein
MKVLLIFGGIYGSLEEVQERLLPQGAHLSFKRYKKGYYPKGHIYPSELSELIDLVIED